MQVFNWEMSLQCNSILSHCLCIPILPLSLPCVSFRYHFSHVLLCHYFYSQQQVVSAEKNLLADQPEELADNQIQWVADRTQKSLLADQPGEADNQVQWMAVDTEKSLLADQQEEADNQVQWLYINFYNILYLTCSPLYACMQKLQNFHMMMVLSWWLQSKEKERVHAGI